MRIQHLSAPFRDTSQWDWTIGLGMLSFPIFGILGLHALGGDLMDLLTRALSRWPWRPLIDEILLNNLSNYFVSWCWWCLSDSRICGFLIDLQAHWCSVAYFRKLLLRALAGGFFDGQRVVQADHGRLRGRRSRGLLVHVLWSVVDDWGGPLTLLRHEDGRHRKARYLVGLKKRSRYEVVLRLIRGNSFWLRVGALQCTLRHSWGYCRFWNGIEVQSARGQVK